MTISGFSLTTLSETSAPATIFKRLMAVKGTDLTRSAYASDLRDFAEFLGIPSKEGKHPLTSVPDTSWQTLDTSHVAAYLEYLKQATSRKTGRSYSPATIARRITAVRELLTEAAYQGLYPRDRLQYLKERLPLPDITHEHHTGLTPGEQTKLLSEAKNQPGLKGLRDYALFRLWLDTGLRRGELAALKVRDLTVKEGTTVIVVRHGKRGRMKQIGLESYTAHVLREWLKVSGQSDQPDRPMFFQVRKRGQAGESIYVPVDPNNPLTGTALYKIVRWYCAQAAIASEVTPHSFRVSFTTDTLAGGASIQHVQAQGGWTSTRMITEVYDRNQYIEPVARYRKHQLPHREPVERYMAAAESNGEGYSLEHHNHSLLTTKSYD